MRTLDDEGYGAYGEAGAGIWAARLLTIRCNRDHKSRDVGHSVRGHGEELSAQVLIPQAGDDRRCEQ